MPSCDYGENLALAGFANIDLAPDGSGISKSGAALITILLCNGP